MGGVREEDREEDREPRRETKKVAQQPGGTLKNYTKAQQLARFVAKHAYQRNLWFISLQSHRLLLDIDTMDTQAKTQLMMALITQKKNIPSAYLQSFIAQYEAK